MATRKKKAASLDVHVVHVEEAPATDPVLEEKRALLDELTVLLRASLDVMMQAAHTAHEAATHPEMRPENDKDTRGIEAGYLAAGQSARALELQRALSDLAGLAPGRVDVVSTLALVEIDETIGEGIVRLRVFLAPHASGQKVKVMGREAQLVSPGSPLGQALMGKAAGDVVELKAGGRVRELELSRVL